MEFPLQAPVECTDGACGRLVYVLIDPLFDQVTNLVVRETFSNTEYIVPLGTVSATTADTIQLRCSKADMEKMNPFVQTEFIEEKLPDRNFGFGNGVCGMGSYYYIPYITPEKAMQVPVMHLQIPPGELAVPRGTRVEATDGYVGKDDELMVNSENGHITNMVMREGHLWEAENAIIPLSAMDDCGDDTLFLNMDKQQIESLPTFPAHWLCS